jgi:hypothetical protein
MSTIALEGLALHLVVREAESETHGDLLSLNRKPVDLSMRNMGKNQDVLVQPFKSWSKHDAGWRLRAKNRQIIQFEELRY